MTAASSPEEINIRWARRSLQPLFRRSSSCTSPGAELPAVILMAPRAVQSAANGSSLTSGEPWSMGHRRPAVSCPAATWLGRPAMGGAWRAIPGPGRRAPGRVLV
jgi:hypothetical protein